MRDQLEVRGQLNKGLKSQLLARLQKCLKTEQVRITPKDNCKAMIERAVIRKLLNLGI